MPPKHKRKSAEPTKGTLPKRKAVKKPKDPRVPEDKVDRLATLNAMHRLARRGGVKRVARLVLPEMRATMATFVKKLVNDAMVYAENARRTTVTAQDVIFALRHRKMHLYGYD